MFTEMKWYGMGDLNNTEGQKCSQRASIIFLQYFYNTFAICLQGACLRYFYNMFARIVFYNSFHNIFTILLQYVRKAHVYNAFTICSQGACFTIVFTIFLAECFVQCLYKYSVSPFYFFYNIHTQGKVGVAGSPLFIRYYFFIIP